MLDSHNKMQDRIKLTYACFLNSSGYSMAAQDLILALDQSDNYDIKLDVFGNKPARPAISDERYEKFIKMIHKKDDPERIAVFHCIPTLQKRKMKVNRKKTLGFSVFETFEPPEKWLQILNNNDALIVPSLFDYKVFAHANVRKPIFHIPHCLDTELYNRHIEPLNKYDCFSFLFMGAWKIRKGYKQLIEAWLKEFIIKDRVQLVIKTDKPQKAQRYVEKTKKQLGIPRGFAPILFESQVFDEKTLPRFMKSFDCFVLSTSGEGFCIPPLHCMALGIPVIITDFSGCKEYANENTATLIKTSGFIMHRDMDGIPQFRNKKWAFVKVEDIRKKMRYVLDNPEMIKKKTNNAYEFVIKNFNYEKIENLFREMLRSLYNV